MPPNRRPRPAPSRPRRVVPARLGLALLAAAAPAAVAAGDAGTRPLNDTGMNLFHTGSATVPGGEPADYPGQDASLGRDAARADSVLARLGAGRAGFDFTKLDAGGQPLAIQDQAWLRDGDGFDAGDPAAGTRWHCVRDNATGLVWEVKTRRAPADLFDSAWTYSWYSSAVRPDGTANGNNGGDAGGANRGTCLDRHDPVDNPSGNFCDTAGYVAAVNAAGLCGASDWRMPTRAELAGLLDLGSRAPAIDTHYFPNVPGDWGNPNVPPNITWTGTPAAFSDSAWSVYFEFGAALPGNGKNGARSVRLVRSAP
ncbi:MAG: DUF1566 domain-containing protein [Pseudoxanthomonas sp.]|nr:DUF1566 domain-containing protein [Pseudoxanthomonas sp.]